jgi:RNA polymerase sigma-70 factor (ECF subfamily)
MCTDLHSEESWRDEESQCWRDFTERLLLDIGTPLDRYIFARVGNRWDADDAFAETTLRFWQKFGEGRFQQLGYLGQSPPFTDGTIRSFVDRATRFIFGIARNVCREHFRKHFKKKEPLIEEPQDLHSSAGDDAAQDDVFALLHQLVDELPDSLNILVMLHYYSDMDEAKIAEVLHISKRTVRSKLKQAQDKLRHALRAHDLTREDFQ